MGTICYVVEANFLLISKKKILLTGVSNNYFIARPSLQPSLCYSTHNDANTLCFPSKGIIATVSCIDHIIGNDRFLHIRFIGFHYFLERVDTADCRRLSLDTLAAVDTRFRFLFYFASYGRLIISLQAAFPTLPISDNTYA